MDPLQTLEKLKSGATTRTSRSLDSVFKVCQGQVDRKVYDFSYVTISRLGKGLGVPRPQSIRNSNGEVYRVLIQAFAESVANKPKQKKNTGSDAWIDDISDITQRYLTQSLLSELKVAKQTLREMVPPSLEIIVDDRGSIGTRENKAAKLTKSETSALQYLLSEDFLKQWRFEKGEYGDVVDENGNRIFKPATIDAIEKALRYL